MLTFLAAISLREQPNLLQSVGNAASLTIRQKDIF